MEKCAAPTENPTQLFVYNPDVSCLYISFDFFMLVTQAAFILGTNAC